MARLQRAVVALSKGECDVTSTTNDVVDAELNSIIISKI